MVACRNITETLATPTSTLPSDCPVITCPVIHTIPCAPYTCPTCPPLPPSQNITLTPPTPITPITKKPSDDDEDCELDRLIKAIKASAKNGFTIKITIRSKSIMVFRGKL